MSKTWKRWAEDVWYQDAWLGIILLPFAYVFYDIVRLRRFFYRKGWANSYRLPVPVVVVGNLTVGGTGKTPLVVWLAQTLANAGYKPGIICRGYGGRSETWPRIVNETSNAYEIGDEPLLIFRQTQLPVVAGPNRVESGKKLLSKFDCNIIISDDGLQHYKLQRDLEIVVIDGERRFGNGYLLPAGPLREPLSRLQEVDFIVVNGENHGAGEIPMQLAGKKAVNLSTGEIKPLWTFKGGECHAIAAIGNPGRFFSALKKQGLTCQNHAFSDHYAFVKADIDFGDTKAVLMTEKDAVKCFDFADERHWYVPAEAELAAGFAGKLIERLTQSHDR